MTENRFRVPADEFYAGVHVPVDAQVEVHSEPEQPAPVWTTDPTPWLDGGGRDVEGDAD
jgi:hypothetical protein